MQNGTERQGQRARMPRWPLVPIALPAAVAIWSGWVGLGALCGFGPVHVLPGISDLTINTAICLPIGMEAYAAYALAVWLRPEPVPEDARVFAKWSAGGALALGLLGQVAFHVLTSRGLLPAPVPVVVLVSCIPVGVVGLAAALVHLMSRPQEEVSEEADEPEPETASVPASVAVSVPKLREIQRRRNCNQETAKKALAEVLLYKRSRDGALPGPYPAVPAAITPAGTASPRVPAGAALNGNAR